MTPPPIYVHACNLYAAFEGAAHEVTDEKVAHDYGVPVGAKLFVGHWSTTFTNKTDYPDLPGESTQQKAYAFLQNTGCLEVLRPGGRDYPGVIILHRPPTLKDATDAPSDTRATRAGKLGVVETAVEGHTVRIGNLEEAVEVLSQRQDAIVRSVEVELMKLSARMDAALDTKTT